MRPSSRRMRRTHGSRPAASRAGFTLAELLVSMTMLTVVMGSVMSVMMQVQRDYSRQQLRDGSMTAVRSAELLIGRALRTAGADPNKVGVVGITAPDSGKSSIRVRADFNPADGDTNDDLEDVSIDLSGDKLRVKWRGDGVHGTLASPISSMTFEYFRRDGTQLTNFAHADSAKRIRIVITSPMVDRNGNSTTLRSESWAFVRND